MRKRFDFAEYNRRQLLSGAYKRKRKKIEARVIQDYDKDFEARIYGINGYTPPEEFSRIKITKAALEKAQFISKRVVDIVQENKIDSTMESSILLLGEKEDMVTRDVYISKKQNVSPVLCELTGSGLIRSRNDIKVNTNYKISGWCHSHGNLGTNPSGLDQRTLINLVSDLGFTKEIDLLDRCPEQSVLREVRYFPSLIINARNTAPTLSIGISYRKLSGGDVYRELRNVSLEVVDEGPELEIDKQEVDNQILERVTIMNKGNLGDIISGKYSRKKDDLEEKTDLIPEQEEKNLVERISALETRYEKLETRYNELERKYLTLEAAVLRHSKPLRRIYAKMRDKLYPV